MLRLEKGVIASKVSESDPDVIAAGKREPMIWI